MSQPAPQPTSLPPGSGNNCPSCGGPGLALAGDVLECTYCGSQFARPPSPIAAALPSGRAFSRETMDSSMLAKVSLVAAIIGWTFVPVVGSVIAVGAGIMAMRQIRASGGALGGSWQAAIGVVLGSIQLLLLLLFVLILVITAVASTST